MCTCSIYYVVFIVAVAFNFRFKSQVLAYDFFDDFTTEQWYTQRLDHFNSADQRTWLQRFLVNKESYIDGGPVFIKVGGEDAADHHHLMHQGAWIEWGEELNALLIQLEHRYYGKSHPTEDTSVENLQYLSVGQALADLASFRKNISVLYKLPNTTKWIFFGGSYPGALAAWFRAKYPELADGVVASSAVILPQASPNEFLTIVNDVLFAYKPTCVSAVTAAFKQIEDLLDEGTSGWDEVTDKFSFCEPLKISDAQKADIFCYLANKVSKIVQYNTEYKLKYLDRDLNETEKRQTDIEKFCKKIENGLTFPLEIDRLALVIRGNLDCTREAYGTSIQKLQMTEWNSTDVDSGNRQYIYQVCTELGFFISSDVPNQPFGNSFPFSFALKQCADIFGPKFDGNLLQTGVNRLISEYGGRDIKVSNVIFPIGTKDPWKSQCLLHDVNSQARVIFIEGGSHCSDMDASDESDIPELVSARQEIRKEIEKWIS